MRVGGVVDAPVQVAEPGEAGRHGGDGELARVDVVDLVPGDRRGHGRLGHAAHRVGAGDGVVPGVLVVVHEQLGRVPVLAPPGGGHLVRARGARPPGRRRARPGAARRSSTAARSARRRAGRGRRRSWASRPRPARRAPRARRGRPGARCRTRSAASGPGRCATRRAARCRPGGSSTGGTPRWTSAPPTPRWPARSRTARRRAGRSAGSRPGPSPATAARRAGRASGAPSPRRRRTGSGASCTAARAARGRSRRRPTGSSSTRSSLVSPRAGKYTRSGLVIRTTRPPTSTSAAALIPRR